MPFLRASLLSAGLLMVVSIIAGADPVPGTGLNDEQVRVITELINLDYPGLEKARAAAERADWNTVKHELASHFRTRNKPQWPYKPTEAGTLRAHLRNNADEILRHEFNLYRKSVMLGPKIDWDANPVGDREWTWGLNRHWHFKVLGEAYAVTKDERYAREFVDEMTDWVLTRASSNPEIAAMSWRPIEAGIRMFGSWVPAWYSFLNSPSFTDDARLLMLKSFAEHADYLLKHPRGGNHLLMESNGLAHVGVVFPEFKDAELWRKTAFERLNNEMKRQVYPDGMQFELSTSYHQVSLFNFLQPVVLASVGNVDLPQNYLDGVLSMIRLNADLARPDGSLPLLNDSDTTLMDDIRTQVEKEASHLTPALRRELGKALAGTSPGKSTFFPYAGLLVMRGGTGLDARYLLMDAGPFGAGHQHEDKLSLDIFAYGQSLILDPGRYSYTGEGGWFRSAVAHNAVLVDGQGQNRRGTGNTERIVDKPAPDIRWTSGDGFDFGEGIYASGFGKENNLKVTHSRKVFFFKPDYWVVSDHFDGEGRHQIESLWHFNKGRAAVDSTMAVHYLGSEAQLRLIPSMPGRVQTRLYSGQENPRRGWISPEYNIRFPAPEAGVTSTLELPASLETVLYPAKLGKVPVAAVRALPVEIENTVVSDGAASALEVRHSSGRDMILFSHTPEASPELKHFGDLAADAEIAAVRRRPDGSISRVVLLNGCELQRNGLSIIRCGSSIEHLELELTKGAAKLRGKLHGEIRIPARSAVRVFVNGCETPSRIDGTERVISLPDNLTPHF